MKPHGIGCVFIVGAGFSSYAGLPLQKDFTKALLEAIHYKETAPSKLIVEYLSVFIQKVFGAHETAGAREWPELEDIFTNIDLPANTGHYLGADYSPTKLRTLRRALIARIIRMLRSRYEQARRDRGDNWRRLENVFGSIDLASSAFISMNWDTVVEEGISAADPELGIDYGCDSVFATFPKNGRKIKIPVAEPRRMVPVVKIHGSTNWLYCDNCRSVFAFPAGQTIEIAKQLLSKEDWGRIDPEHSHAYGQWRCVRCPRVPLSTRLATFSYLKALDFPMFQKSWSSAAGVLQGARTWVFIGYSLPPADYEFKHLLKRVQLSHKDGPRLILITGGDNRSRTEHNYRRFFGTVKVFSNGISDDAVSFLRGT